MPAFRHRNLVLLLATTLLYIASQAHIIVVLGPQAEDILRFQTTFSPSSFWQIVDAWGAEGKARYLAHFPYDALHALIYGVLGLVITICTPLFGSAWHWPRRLAVAALPVAALCDLVENYGHETLLRDAPGVDPGLIPLAAAFASAKWLIVALFACAVAAATLRRLWRRP